MAKLCPEELESCQAVSECKLPKKPKPINCTGLFAVNMAGIGGKEQ